MRLIVATLIGALLASPTFAQQISPMTGTTESPAPGTAPGPATTPPARTPRAHHPRMKFPERFASANTTHDGHLTRDQAQTAHMRMIARDFDQIDTAHKGYVTMDDVRTYRRAQRLAKQNRN